MLDDVDWQSGTSGHPGRTVKPEVKTGPQVKGKKLKDCVTFFFFFLKIGKM